MRKYLLSTSALAGAALLSTTAIADVTISGYSEFAYHQNDHSVAVLDGNNMGLDQEVHINFSKGAKIHKFKLKSLRNVDRKSINILRNKEISLNID